MGVGAEVSGIVDRIGFGPWHIKHVFLGAGLVWSDGAELLLIGAVANTLKRSLDITPKETASLVSIVFFGALVGSVCAGYIGDRFGRRLPVGLAAGVMGLASVLSASAYSFGMLAVCRFICGITIGIGVLCWNALASEIAPSSGRPYITASGKLLYSVGQIYGASLLYYDDPSLKHLHWRSLLVFASIPCFLICILALLFLTESPHYLAIRGRKNEAEEVLRGMAEENGQEVEVELVECVGVDETSNNTAFAKALTCLFSKEYRYTTFTMSMVVLSGYIMSTGLFYGVPQILEKAGLPVSPATNMIIGAVVEIPGCIMASVIGVNFDRKITLQVLFCFCMISQLSFAVAVSDYFAMQSTGLHQIATYSYYCAKFGQKALWVIIFLYLVEVFPTTVRVSAQSFCVGFGRLGSIMAPILYEHLKEETGQYVYFFFMVVAICLVNICLIRYLPYETRNTLLKGSFEKMESENEEDQQKPLHHELQFRLRKIGIRSDVLDHLNPKQEKEKITGMDFRSPYVTMAERGIDLKPPTPPTIEVSTPRKSRKSSISSPPLATPKSIFARKTCIGIERIGNKRMSADFGAGGSQPLSSTITFHREKTEYACEDSSVKAPSSSSHVSLSVRSDSGSASTVPDESVSEDDESNPFSNSMKSIPATSSLPLPAVPQRISNSISYTVVNPRMSVTLPRFSTALTDEHQNRFSIRKSTAGLAGLLQDHEEDVMFEEITDGIIEGPLPEGWFSLDEVMAQRELNAVSPRTPAKMQPHPLAKPSRDKRSRRTSPRPKSERNDRTSDWLASNLVQQQKAHIQNTTDIPKPSYSMLHTAVRQIKNIKPIPFNSKQLREFVAEKTPRSQPRIKDRYIDNWSPSKIDKDYERFLFHEKTALTTAQRQIQEWATTGPRPPKLKPRELALSTNCVT